MARDRNGMMIPPAGQIGLGELRKWTSRKSVDPGKNLKGRNLQNASTTDVKAAELMESYIE